MSEQGLAPRLAKKILSALLRSVIRALCYIMGLQRHMHVCCKLKEHPDLVETFNNEAVHVKPVATCLFHDIE
jgi:hypothetical protein